MNEQNNHNENPLHLQTDPDLERIESMLAAIAEDDREAMSEQTRARVLGSVSGVFAPTPISIERSQQVAEDRVKQPVVWKLRIAATLLVVSAASIGVVITKPWSSPPAQPTPTNSAQSDWSLASFEKDFDAYLALEEVGDDLLDEAVTDWELWAQTIDTDVDASFFDQDLLVELNDGAI